MLSRVGNARGRRNTGRRVCRDQCLGTPVPGVPRLGHFARQERNRWPMSRSAAPVAEPAALSLPLVMPIYRPGTRDARRLLYDDAMAIIEREYRFDLQLDGVAARIFTSRRSLQRAFNDAGRSFRGEHLRARLRAAAAAMRADPQRTVRDVSLAVGYRQPAQFAKAFRREFGVSPAVYRRAAARAREH